MARPVSTPRPPGTGASNTRQPPSGAQPPRAGGQTMPQPEPARPMPVGPPTPHPAPDPNVDSGVSPFMQGSLPPVASGGDAYTRQFYGGANLPKRRFLPVSLIP